MQFWWDRLCALVCLGTALLALAGCGGGSEEASSAALRNDQGVVISGTVLDGPVVGATIEVISADGAVVSQATGDDRAGFQALVPANTTYPITLRATGGTNVVTSRAPDFVLEALVGAPDQAVVNLTPFSTVVAKLAACSSGKPSRARLAKAWATALEHTGMGLDTERVDDPSALVLGPETAADLVLAGEAFAETVRRAVTNLNAAGHSVNGDALIAAVGCDLADDGALDGDGEPAARRAVATFRSAAAGVLVELMARRIRIDGTDGVDVLDAAVSTMLAADGVRSVRDVGLTDAAVRQARGALSLMLRPDMGEVPARYVALLDQSSLVDLPAAVAGRLGSSDMSALADAARRVADLDEPALDALLAAVGQRRASAPLISFSATPEQVFPDGTARLSWAAANSETCWAAGAWAGAQPVSGSYVTDPLSNSQRFELTCSGHGGTQTTDLTVAVDGSAPPALPAVTLTSSAATVEPGASVTLQWSSVGTTACSASGDWSGARPTQGSAVVGPLQATGLFSLTCQGPGGEDSDGVMVTVGPAQPVSPPSTPPAPPQSPAAVSASLQATPAWIAPGTSAQLSWSSAGATTCAASGAWSGTKPLTGAVTVGPLSADSAFSLTCTGAGGNAVASTTVSMRAARLSWQPTGGNPQDVASIKVRYGTAPGQYGNPPILVDPALSQYRLTLAPGTYYFVIAPVNSAGAEGPRSNEVSKTIE